MRTLHRIAEVLAILLTLASSTAAAKATREIGAAFTYSNKIYQDSDGTHKALLLHLSTQYLQEVKTFWSGFEFSYTNELGDVYDESHFLIGVPFKYWFMGPDSKGLGFYTTGTPYFGRITGGSSSDNVFGAKAAIGTVLFQSDMVGIDTRFQYDYQRRAGNPVTTMSVLIGVATFF